jgi:hypothetical protein
MPDRVSDIGGAGGAIDDGEREGDAARPEHPASTAIVTAAWRIAAQGSNRLATG